MVMKKKKEVKFWNDSIQEIAKLSKPVVIESTTGYSCPNCGAICSHRTLISRTEAEFEEYPEPHYSWDETHKCQKCGTLYLLHNGT